MVSLKRNISLITLILIIFSFIACKSNSSSKEIESVDSRSAFNYLKGLEGKWVVLGEKEGTFGWEFDLTCRGKVIIEKLKVGTPAEMTTVYAINNGKLVANHYCQLNNQPSLTHVASITAGDLHFECNGYVGNTKSHDELHMHGVYFQKKGDKMIIWMDMMEHGKIAFETKYELVRIES